MEEPIKSVVHEKAINDQKKKKKKHWREELDTSTWVGSLEIRKKSSCVCVWTKKIRIKNIIALYNIHAAVHQIFHVVAVSETRDLNGQLT